MLTLRLVQITTETDQVLSTQCTDNFPPFIWLTVLLPLHGGWLICAYCWFSNASICVGLWKQNKPI